MEERPIDRARKLLRSNLMYMFHRYGYETQKELAEALQNKGYYEGSKSTRTYLNQVIRGVRNPSAKLLEGLALLCNDDPEIMKLLRPVNRLTIDEHVYLDFEGAYEKIKRRVESLERKERLMVLIDLGDYLKSYLERLK